MQRENKTPATYQEIRSFYNEVYYHHSPQPSRVPRHLCRLAARLGPWRGKQLLDVGCGTGKWLQAVSECGARPVGIDISERAIEACKRLVPEAEVHCSVAESLPFADKRFDAVSCLGALEHFLDPQAALREMIRVAKPHALFLLLVPNAGFLTRRLGIYHGTEQARIREEVRALAGWEELFVSAGLRVKQRFKDLHILSRDWILRGPSYAWPFRAIQAAMLPCWPLAWQYQVYYVCEINLPSPP